MSTASSLPVALRRRMVLAFPLLGIQQAMPVWASPAAVVSPLFVRESRPMMGTRVDIVVPVLSGESMADCRFAVATAFSRMQYLESLLSRYHGDSDIGRVNVAAGAHPVRVAPAVLTVLERAQELYRESDGAFDISVGALRAWSFEPGREHRPSVAQIREALPLVGLADMALDRRAQTVHLRRAGMALDLGGVAKLPILEAGLHVLRGMGIRNALINGGGDVLVAGQQHGQAWRVGVRDPNAPAQLAGVLHLEGEAVVASSGDYERGFVQQGLRLHHVLDPHTGWPAQGIHGVALLARRVKEVNGWGPALMVQGAGALAAWSARHPGVQMLAGLADGSHWVTGRMRQQLVRV